MGRAMVIFAFNEDSLKRHRVTQRECLEALVDPVKLLASSDESKAGNPTTIWVGMTTKGRLLEVGVEYLEDMDWIYHANSARIHYRRAYKRQ